MSHIKHFNLQVYESAGMALQNKAESTGKRRVIPPKVIQQMAADAAEEDNCVRQRCFYCQRVYAISYIRLVMVGWRKNEPVCGLCRKERGIKARDCVR